MSSKITEYRTCHYLVVGAGSSGCVVANRLSANPQNKVILLEAGGRDLSPWIHIPVGYFRTMGDPKLDWCYKTQKDPGLNGRSIPWPRGKVLGGSSSLNGLLYVRGQTQDYEDWKALGNNGWGWDEIAPLFKRVETWHGEASGMRGTDGPLHVSPTRIQRPTTEAWLAAAQNAGYPANPDYNGADQEGVGYFQQTAYKGRRCSTSVSYLKQAKSRQNLEVITKAMVAKILFEGKKAVGVELVDGRKITVQGEIILSAGAIASPQLLAMSGIGDQAELNALGIETVVHAPGVGKAMQDHLQARPVYKTPTTTINIETRSLWRKAMMALEYAVFRTGPMTMAASLATGFLCTEHSPERPDIQYHIQPFSADHPALGPHRFSAFTASVLQMRPTSRGSLEWVSSDIRDYPLIHPNYLDTELDCQTLLAGMRITRTIARTSPLKEIVSEEYVPGAEVADEDDMAMLHWLRQSSTTIYHPTGTCKMGVDEMAVVDPKLRVMGLEGVRVADASIMPIITSGNTNAPCIMIGEKASDLLLQH